MGGVVERGKGKAFRPESADGLVSVAMPTLSATDAREYGDP